MAQQPATAGDWFDQLRNDPNSGIGAISPPAARTTIAMIPPLDITDASVRTT